MPEAAVDKNAGLIFWQHNIRFARKSFVVDAVAITVGKQILSDNHFRLRVFSFDMGHVITTRLLIVYISHI